MGIGDMAGGILRGDNEKFSGILEEGLDGPGQLRKSFWSKKGGREKDAETGN